MRLLRSSYTGMWYGKACRSPGAPSQAEHRNLVTGPKVNYIKIHIFRNGNSQEIYLKRQFFGLKLYFWEIAKRVFSPNFISTSVKISLNKITKENCKASKGSNIHVSINVFSLLWLIFYVWKYLHILLKKLIFNFERQSKPLLIIIRFYHWYFADT